MRLTVLGKYGPFTPPGGATSGYLVETKTTKLLVDAGSGVMSRLQWFSRVEDIAAIALSHLHADHTADMQLFAYGLDMLSKRVPDVKLPLNVFAPATPQEEYARIKKNDAFNVSAIYDRLRIEVGDIAITFYKGTHPVESYAMDISADGKRLFYTGDTAEDRNVMDAVAGADVLLCDVNFVTADARPGSPHLTTRQAAELAVEARVGQLICTHIFPRYSDDQVLKEVKPIFERSSIAEEFKIYEF